MSDRGEPADITGRIRDVVSGNHVMTLACRDAEGCWASALFYVAEEFDLLFCSSAGSRHVRALAVDDRPAAEIHASASDWRSIVGLQLSGRVQALPIEQAAEARGRYARRFPFVDAENDPALAHALDSVSWFHYRIEQAVLIDNVHGFGRRARWCRTPSIPWE